MADRRKVVLLGPFATGKSSLVRRFVHGTFSDDYFTTIGVRIEKSRVVIDGRPLDLVLWDLHGDDRFQTVERAYLRGAAAALVVLDLSRPTTFRGGLNLAARLFTTAGPIPVVWALNKTDLVDLERCDLPDLPPGCRSVYTSARTGDGVRAAFAEIGRALLDEEARRAP